MQRRSCQKSGERDTFFETRYLPVHSDLGSTTYGCQLREQGSLSGVRVGWRDSVWEQSSCKLRRREPHPTPASCVKAHYIRTRPTASAKSSREATTIYINRSTESRHAYPYKQARHELSYHSLKLTVYPRFTGKGTSRGGWPGKHEAVGAC